MCSINWEKHSNFEITSLIFDRHRIEYICGNPVIVCHTPILEPHHRMTKTLYRNTQLTIYHVPYNFENGLLVNIIYSEILLPP